MTDGILVVNKPEGLSSAGVVGKLKRILRPKKIGHTGTLDPFATGVLLIAIGNATRISRFFLDGTKEYLATVTLGIETDTYDCTGQPVSQLPSEELSHLCLDTVRAAAATFLGEQDQVAPAYSALKHNGVPLYKLARQGKAIQKPPRRITIHHISVDNFRLSAGGYPEFDLLVGCSGGTYIRSLAYDLGRALGCGAHLSGLIRTRSSQFRIEDAVSLDGVESAGELESRVVSMNLCLDFLPKMVASDAMAKRISHGQAIEISPSAEPGITRAVDDKDRLLALLEPDPNGQTYNYCCVFHY